MSSISDNQNIAPTPRKKAETELRLVKKGLLTTRMHIVASDLSSEQTHRYHLVLHPTVTHNHKIKQGISIALKTKKRIGCKTHSGSLHNFKHLKERSENSHSIT